MTHVPLDVDSINWDQFLLSSGNQEGEGATTTKYFVGQKYMRGYGILGNIGKFLLPIAKNIATSVGSEGVEAGTRILKDVTEGKEFSDALKEHSRKGLENLADKIKQCGRGGQKGGGKRRRRKRKELIFGVYPPRPESPTSSSMLLTNRRQRKKQSTTTKHSGSRKPKDQLDIF
jgi:hypothetical protein